MKRIYLLLLLCVLSIAARAQTAASYIFTRATGSYTSIAGASGTTSTTSISGDDYNLGGISIGFSFVYCGTAYTTLSACSNGWLSLANSTATVYYNDGGMSGAANSGVALLMAYWDDLNGSGKTAYYQTTGTAPNRIFTFQWGDPTTPWGNYSGGGSATFQIKLYESSNVIQYIYGAGSYGSSATIGISNSATDLLDLATQSSTTASTTFSSGVTGSPAANSEMTWTPPPTLLTTPAAMTFTTLTATTSATQTVNISGYGFTSSPVTLTAPTNFQIYNGSTWVTSYTVATSSVSPTVGTYIPTTAVQVRFNAPSTVGTTTGNLAMTGAGLASAANVALTGNAVNPCSGSPTAGTPTVTPAIGGTATAFTLSVTGYTLAAGITFQWQSSPDGSSSWSNISGATNDTYTFTGISAATYYRVNVTCTNSSITVASGVISATYLPPATCGTTSSSFYYSPATSYMMTNFTLNGYSGSTINDNGPSSHPASGYEDRTGVVSAVDLMQANSYTGSISYNSSYYFENQIWIDFNNNGTFENTEIVTPVINGAFVSSSSFTLTVPSGAPTGYRRMRVRTAMTYNTTMSSLMSPCSYADPDYFNYYYYGTTRDYVANIVPQPVCTGTPSAGTVVAGSSIGCGTLVTTLSTSGATSPASYAGLTFQWQSSPDNSTWTSISGATNVTAPITTSTTIYYRSRITCSTSSITSSSAGVQLTVNPLPAPITGNTLVCAGGTTTLASATSGGTWSSSNTSVANINSSTGITTIGSTAGYAMISYTLTSTGCRQVTAINVNTLTPTAAASASPGVICSGGSSTLSASNSTTMPGYYVTAIPYSFVPLTSPTNLTTSYGGTDDDYGTVTLPFSVTFFGTTYSTVYPTTNGYLQFTSPSTNYGGSSLPSTSMPYPAITLFHRDLNVAGAGGSIKYSTEGTAPNRKFVIYYNNICDYSYTTGGNTGEIILYEGSNRIDVLIASTTSNYHVCAAVQNATASTAYWAPNRNYGYYQVSTPEAWSFNTPSVQYTWSPSATLSATTGTPVTATNVTTTPGVTYSVGITYNGCVGNATTTLTVNPLPAAITGTPQVCAGLTTPLATTSTGGTWTSSNTAAAGIGSTMGVVSGVAAGTSNVSYTFTGTGCRTTQVVTVNPLPADITGTASACVGATTTLTDATASGTWSSGTSAVAFIDAATGVVNGASAGLAMITYMLPTGCIKSVETTINPLPVTTISPASSVTICAGDGAALTANAPLPSFSILNQDFNSGLGGWSIDNLSGDPASYWHITSSTASGATGDGTPMMESNAQFATPTTTMLTSPGFSTLGYGTATVKFNEYLISVATSDANVDLLYSIDNGATWTSIVSQVGEMNGSGTWSSSSTPEVSVALPAGALGQPNLKLRWYYNSNYGLYWNVDNIKVIAYQPPATYVWNPIGGATGLSCSSCGATTITPTATGANVYSITTTTSAGCQSTVGATVSVNPLPSAIAGSTAVCVNSSITMTDADAGGTWSSADATVSVATSTGVVTGVTAGPALITYTLVTGCRITTPITVNALPANITGTQQVCEGLTTTLSNTTSGGTWSSSMSAVASVDASGVVTGNAFGITDIYYTLTATGCRIAANVTVNPTPAAITGGMQVCEGLTTALADADAAGTWTSGTTAVATVVPASGVVSGVSAGMSTITYQLPTGCINTAVVTVNPLPAVITGTMQVCEGLTTGLGDITAGGNWSSSSVYASVGATGVVTGITQGVETITYQLPTTCLRTANVTVNPLPAAITGATQVCAGLTTALNNASTGGTWTSGSTGIATVNPVSGVVTGVTAGPSTITYQLPTGCISTVGIIVNPLPAAISGIRQVCEGLTTTLGNTSLGGTWASSASGVASVDASGIVSGLSFGVTTITYQLPTSCIMTADVTVNPLPATIMGAAQVCEASSTALSNAVSGGTWSSGATSVATVNPSGTVFGVTAGPATITYQLSTGCIRTINMVVNPRPATISGATQVCATTTTNLTDATSGGTWSSSTTTAASIDATGLVSGIAAGTSTITYALATGCYRTSPMVVNPQPASIDGLAQVCQGLTTTLSNTSVGGTWVSGAIGFATVGAGSGIVSGVSAGPAPVTYTLPTGCRVNTTVTVNPNPAAITGVMQVCAVSNTALADADAGGVWTSSVPALASVTPATGVVTGINMGTTTIIYTLPTTCKATAVITVNPLPAPIAGDGRACEGTVALFTNGSAGGTWTGNTPLVATIDNGTGEIDAIASGTTLITYTLPTGCLRTRVFTVNALPAAITGTTQVCETATTMLSNATGGGVWSSGSAANATINSIGIVSGVAAGITPVTYMLATGCMAMTLVTVNQLPSAIAGSATACVGQTTTLSNTVSGGSWSTTSSAIATADATTGVITGVMAGITAATYTMPSGCKATRNVVVNTTPAAIGGATAVCQGSSMTMTNATTGGAWTSSAAGIASINLSSGMLSGLTPGTVTISYTLLTGCTAAATVVVDALPSAVSGSFSVCNGQSTTLSSATTGGSWVSSNSAIAAVTSAGVVTGATAGNVTIGYTTSAGCTRNSIVTVNALPSVHNMTGGGSYCVGGSGVHIGLDVSNTGINYHMYSGSTPIVVVPGTSGLPLDFGLIAPAGTYNVIARNPSTGCTSNMTGIATVAVNPVVVPEVAISSADVVCDASLTTFVSLVTNGGTTPVYVWKVNGATQPGATSATFNYTPANGDVVTSLITSSAACAIPSTASLSKTMTVNANVMPVANITATPGNVVCNGNTATFTVSSLYGGTLPAYTWLKNGAVAGTGTTFAYTPANGDHVAVKMASNYGCRLADSVTSGTITMATTPIYIPAITIAVNPGNHINPGTNVTLTANVASGGPAPEYQWFINSTPIPSATNATFTYSMFTEGDSVSCQVTGTGACGMSAFNSVIMHVGPSGISGVGISDVRLVPNPNKGLFTVKGTLATAADEEVVLEVTNMLGQVVYRQGVSAKNGLINEQVQLSNTLSNGMYMLNVKTAGDSKVFHFVLEQ